MSSDRRQERLSRAAARLVHEPGFDHGREVDEEIPTGWRLAQEIRRLRSDRAALAAFLRGLPPVSRLSASLALTQE